MIDFVAGAFELCGLWCVGNKWRIGFILNLLAGFVWIYVGWRVLAWISLDVSGFTSICIELRGQLRRWRGCAWIRKDASRN